MNNIETVGTSWDVTGWLWWWAIVAAAVVAFGMLRRNTNSGAADLLWAVLALAGTVGLLIAPWQMLPQASGASYIGVSVALLLAYCIIGLLIMGKTGSGTVGYLASAAFILPLTVAFTGQMRDRAPGNNTSGLLGFLSDLPSTIVQVALIVVLIVVGTKVLSNSNR